MSLATAQNLAWSLATTLMVCITLFRTELGYGVLPSAEYDGDPEGVLHVYDPFA
jgi:hypothetical protein